jgi:hypothetical protein
MAYSRDKNKLIFKFNGGLGAILCSNCGKIIATGSRIPEKFWVTAAGMGTETYESIGPQFCCKDCEQEWFDTIENYV